MKTVSLSISNRLKGIISLFRSFESKPRYGTKQQSQAINNKEITDGTQAMNQVHAGHFLSGPHGIFNPQLI